MMLFDFKCPRHGVFESSHAICPNFGCDSEGVEKVFIKAPGTKSDYTKRFDAGIRKSAEMYGQGDFRSAREGEVAKANNRANELMWGDDAAKVLGRSAGEAVGGAAGKAEPSSSPPSGWAPSLVTAASPLARSERTGVKKQDDQWRQQLTSVAKEATTK